MKNYPIGIVILTIYLVGSSSATDSDNSFSNGAPRVETYRKDSDYVVRVDLPGVDPKDVHVEAEGNLLSITGERKGEEKGPEYRETFYGKA